LKKEKHGLQTFVNRFQSGGYDLIDTDQTQTVEPFDKTTANIDWSFQFNDKTSLQLTNRLYRQNHS